MLIFGCALVSINTGLILLLFALCVYGVLLVRHIRSETDVRIEYLLRQNEEEQTINEILRKRIGLLNRIVNSDEQQSPNIYSDSDPRKELWHSINDESPE